MSLLLAARCDANAHDTLGCIALILAARSGHEAVATLLIDVRGGARKAD